MGHGTRAPAGGGGATYNLSMLVGPRLSVAMAGLEIEPAVLRGLRGIVEWAAGRGFGAVQINAAAAGLRPRELGRSARRDLAALLRRSGMECSGLDLWIPPEHFTQAAMIDRAIGAVGEAAELASEIAGLGAGRRGGMAVCVALPREGAQAARGELAARAAGQGVRVADFGWPPVGDEAGTGVGAVDGIGVGMDPAAVIAAGDEPAVAAARLGSRVMAARLSDVSRLGGRVGAGSREGRLDMLAYRVALQTSGFGERGGSVVLDLRGVPGQEQASAAAIEAWRGPVP